MKYIIDEDEFAELILDFRGSGKLYSEYISNFLKSKKPVELVAEGKLSIHEFADDFWCCYADTLEIDTTIADNHSDKAGKHIKIYIESKE